MCRARTSRVSRKRKITAPGMCHPAPKNRHVVRYRARRRSAIGEGYNIVCTYTFISRRGWRFTLFTPPLQPLKLHVARHGKRRFIFRHRTPFCLVNSFVGYATYPPTTCKRRIFLDSAIKYFLSLFSSTFFSLLEGNSAILETDNISRMRIG